MWENMWSFHALSVPLLLNLHFPTSQEAFGFLTSLLEYLWHLSPTDQETQVQSQGSEDSLEKDIETHSSILAWKILWTEAPGGLQSMGLQRVRHYYLVIEHQQNNITWGWLMKFGRFNLSPPPILRCGPKVTSLMLQLYLYCFYHLRNFKNFKRSMSEMR